MYTIRGATTITKDTPEQIQSAMEELLTLILQKNALQKTDIVTVLCSVTTDIQSAYPVKYVRLFGLSHATLFSFIEPQIQNSLPYCIRLLLFVNRARTPQLHLANLLQDLQIADFSNQDETIKVLLKEIKELLPLQQEKLLSMEKQPKVEHVYLHGAKFLRTDIQKINIAIDGPAGSGKSTLAKLLAERLGIEYLDTGAMYRATSLYLIEQGIAIEDEKAVAAAMLTIPLQVEYREHKQYTLLNGKDVAEKIRTPQIAMTTAIVAQKYAVRAKLIAMQQQIAKQYSCVVDGRDIGYNVLPNAQYKFFLTADAKVRAERRKKELEAKGEKVNFDKLLQEIVLRDKQDAERELAPLKQAEDAILVDTTTYTLQEVLQYVLQILMQ